MLEFTQWYFVLVINFLVLLVILNFILFQPLKKVFKEREGTIKGDLDEAKDLTAKREETITKVNAELSAARNKAKDIYNALRGEGQTHERDVLSKTEAEAVEIIEKARKELQRETEKARLSLKADVDKFSEDIVKKLVRV